MSNERFKLNKPRLRVQTRTRRPAPDATPRFYYKGNRAKQLRAFCYAVKFGTVARAAEALYLSPSSVSLQLTALEKELDTQLLERTRPRLGLTREGQLLYDLARPLIGRASCRERV